VTCSPQEGVECSWSWVAKAGEGLEEDQGWSRAGLVMRGMEGYGQRLGIESRQYVWSWGWMGIFWVEFNFWFLGLRESNSLGLRESLCQLWISKTTFDSGLTEVNLKYCPEETNTVIPC